MYLLHTVKQYLSSSVYSFTACWRLELGQNMPTMYLAMAGKSFLGAVIATQAVELL